MMIVNTALPATTSGLRAPRERLGGGGSCSGSSAARGLRGEIGALSDIRQPDPDLRHAEAFLRIPGRDVIPQYGKRVKVLAISGI
jgi:hypothetical protein